MEAESINRRVCLATLAAAGSASTVGWAGSRAVADTLPPITIPTIERIRAADPKMWKLVDLINEFRRTKGLAAIPLSPRMSVVAALHASDLALRKPHEKFGSLHSWSHGQPRWKGGAYNTADKATWTVMWDKPKEIAAYEGIGFEVAASQCKNMEQVLAAWLASAAHSAVILNRGKWEKMKWQALGAAFEGGFACAWFGEENDAG